MFRADPFMHHFSLVDIFESLDSHLNPSKNSFFGVGLFRFPLFRYLVPQGTIQTELFEIYMAIKRSIMDVLYILHEVMVKVSQQLHVGEEATHLILVLITHLSFYSPPENIILQAAY